MLREAGSKSKDKVKSEVSTLFSTFAISYVLRLGEILMATLVTYFSTRLFVPEIYGQLSMITMAVGIIQAVGFGWLGSALIRFGKEEYIQTGGVCQTFRIRLILLLGIWLTVLIVFASFYFLMHGYLATWIGLSSPILWVIPLLLTLTVLSNELKGYLSIFGKYIPLGGAELVNQIVKVLIVVLLYLYFRASGIGWLLFLIASGIAIQSLYLFAWLERRSFYLENPFGLQTSIRRTVHYSMPAVGTSIMSYIYKPIEIFLIRHFVSMNAVGLFSMAYSLSIIFSSFVMLFPNLTFPILQGIKATDNREAMRRYYQNVVPQMTILFAFFTSACLPCLPFILKSFLHESYHPAIGALVILAYSEIIHFPTALQSSYSYIYDKMSQALWVMLLQYAFQIPCYLLLIPRIGIEGAAWSWVASNLASTVLLTYYVSQEFGVSFRSYLAIGVSAWVGMASLFLVWSEVPFGFQVVTMLGIVITAALLTKLVKLFDRRDAELLLTIGVPKSFYMPLKAIYHALG
jgi:O-antigen/teichoic acid export membrane protein